MKFKFIKEVEGEVGIYGGQKAKTGDVVELHGFFAEKALKNPAFIEVKSKAKKAETKTDDKKAAS